MLRKRNIKYAMLSNLIRVTSQVRTKLSKRLPRTLRKIKDEISSEDRANATKVLNQILEFKVVKPSKEEIYEYSIKRLRNLMVQNAIAKIADILGRMEISHDPSTTNLLTS
jgi:hypothetical protein